MSHHVNDLASSFVEMAKAFEELPRVKAELSQKIIECAEAYSTITSRELRIIDLKNEADELSAKLRKVEAERDDAELRFLEADEKIDAFTRLGRAFAADLGALTKAVEPSPLGESSTTSEKPSSEPSTALQSHSESSIVSTDTSPDTGSSGFDAGSGSTSAAPIEEPLPSEPFSRETKPSDPVEVREEVGPLPNGTASSHTEESIPSANTPAIQSENADIGTAISEGVSVEPLPTAASPIAESTAESTNASPSGDASSPIDNPYADEPGEKWSSAWYDWAHKMDHRYGKFGWPRGRV